MIIKLTGKGGAGRGQGRHKLPDGKKAVTFSVTAPPEVRDKIDQLRGELSRGEWVANDPRLNGPSY